LALVTDVLTEAVDANDDELGLERLKQVLRDSSSRPLSDIADRVIAVSREHGQQTDVQTILLVRALKSFK
jgi:hypothetical protein